MKCRIKFPSSEYQDRKSIRMIPIFNIERQFSFYGAYRNNKWNILVHVLFVWPMVVGLLVLLAYSPVLYPNPPWFSYLPIQITQHMVFNYSFVAACTYAVFYISLDHRAGFLAAFLVMGSWMGANAVAKSLPWDKAWKMVLAGQVVCCTAQFLGRGPYEIGHPNVLENIVQAYLMAPYFVLLELLHFIGYVPYRGFQAMVQRTTQPHQRPHRMRRISWDECSKDSCSSDSECGSECENQCETANNYQAPPASKFRSNRTR